MILSCYDLVISVAGALNELCSMIFFFLCWWRGSWIECSCLPHHERIVLKSKSDVSGCAE